MPEEVSGRVSGSRGIVAADARNGGAGVGTAIGSFFLIWTVTWLLPYACLIPGKGAFGQGPGAGCDLTACEPNSRWMPYAIVDHHRRLALSQLE